MLLSVDNETSDSNISPHIFPMFNVMLHNAINSGINDDDDPNDSIIYSTMSVIISIVESSTNMISLYPMLWSELLLVLVSGFEHINNTNTNSNLLLILGQLILPFTISISDTVASYCSTTNNATTTNGISLEALSSLFEPLVVRVVNCSISISTYTTSNDDDDNNQEEHTDYRVMLRDSLRELVVLFPSLLVHLLTVSLHSVRQFAVSPSL